MKSQKTKVYNLDTLAVARIRAAMMGIVMIFFLLLNFYLSSTGWEPGKWSFIVAVPYIGSVLILLNIKHQIRQNGDFFESGFFLGSIKFKAKRYLKADIQSIAIRQNLDRYYQLVVEFKDGKLMNLDRIPTLDVVTTRKSELERVLE
jgi:hypothetical protein